MARDTRATRALATADVAFTVHAYDYDPGPARVGLQAAGELGEDPARVLKTLMVLLDGKPAIAILPSDRELSMKRFAAALGGKTAAMMPVPQAERVSGYKVGGVSPFGQPRRLPVAIEAAALGHPLVYINGGQRGLQVRMDPNDAVRVLDARAAAIAA